MTFKTSSKKEYTIRPETFKFIALDWIEDCVGRAHVMYELQWDVDGCEYETVVDITTDFDKPEVSCVEVEHLTYGEAVNLEDVFNSEDAQEIECSVRTVLASLVKGDDNLPADLQSRVSNLVTSGDLV